MGNFLLTFVCTVFFDLDFDNWEGIILALLPALLNLCIIIYILIAMPNRAIPRSFVLFTFSLFLWQLDDAFARMSNTAEVAGFWDKIFCLGWIFVGPTGLYFSLLYSGKKSLTKSSVILALIFLPALVFEVFFKLDIHPHIYKYSGFWGWVDNHNMYWLDKLMVGWIGLTVILSMIFLAHYAWEKRNNSLLGSPALLIAIGMAFPTLQGLITQLVFPLVLHIPSIPLTSTFLTFFSIAVAIALRRYRLFSVAEAINTQMLLNNMTDIVFTISPDKKITYINPNGAKILGLDTRNIINYKLENIFHSNKKETRSFISAIITPALGNKHIENISFTFFNAKNEEIYVLVTADSIYDNNMLQGLLVVAHNITEIKIAEDELKEKNLVLERANNELEAFAFVASHDMKEPLRMVSNYTQLLEKRYKDKLDDVAKEYIKFAVEGVHRMQELIKDLLIFTSIGKQELDPEILDMNILLAEVIQEMQAELRSKKAEVNFNKLPSVSGSRKLIKQLLKDLLENALKFARENVPPVINIAAEEKEDEWQFSVQDNGIGIEPEYEGKIFMLFQRLNEREKYKGSGVGLTICKKIVELHGGKIWLKSERNKGCTFYFTIPK